MNLGMDRLGVVELLVRVVESGSFTRAAEDLGIAQPTASKQLAALESRLGVRLLERTTRRVRPTEEGLAYYARAKNLLVEAEALDAEVSLGGRVAGGKLRVSCANALGRLVIAPIVFRYLECFPDARIDFDLNARYLDPVEQGVDVAIRIGEPADSSHRARVLSQSPRVLAASPAYLERAGRPQVPAELARHNVLIYTHLPSPDVLRLRDAAHGEVRVPVQGNLRANNSEVLAAAAESGLGIVCLPHWAMREGLAAGRLEALLPEHEPEGASIFALFPGRRQAPARVRRFLDFLATELVPQARGGRRFASVG